MTADEAIKVMQVERECVMRNDSHQCNRDCAVCDLVLPTEYVLDAYDEVLKMFNKYHKHKKEAKRFKRKYLELRKVIMQNEKQS